MRKRSNSERKAMFAAMAEEGNGRSGPRKAREAMQSAADRVDEALYRVAVEFDNQPVDEESANARARALKGALSELENAEMHLERTVQETGHLWKEEDPGQDVGDEFDDEYEEAPPENDLVRIRRQNRNAERASAEVSDEWGPQPDRPYWVPDNIDEILAEEGPVDDEWGETPLNDIQRILRQNRIVEKISEEMAEELSSQWDHPNWVPDNIDEILAGGPKDPEKDRPKASARAGGKGSRDEQGAKSGPTDLEMTFVKEAPARLLKEWNGLPGNSYPLDLDPPLHVPEKLTNYKPDPDFAKKWSHGGTEYKKMKDMEEALKGYSGKVPDDIRRKVQQRIKEIKGKQPKVDLRHRPESDGSTAGKSRGAYESGSTGKVKKSLMNKGVEAAVDAGKGKVREAVKSFVESLNESKDTGQAFKLPKAPQGQYWSKEQLGKASGHVYILREKRDKKPLVKIDVPLVGTVKVTNIHTGNHVIWRFNTPGSLDELRELLPGSK